MTQYTLFSVGLVVLAAMTVSPMTAGAQTPDVLTKLYSCKSITDSTARLKCYDQNIGFVETAQETGNLIAIDKAGARKIQKESFGFNIPSIPKLGFFGNKKTKGEKSSGDDGFQTVTLEIMSAKKLANGRYQFKLKNDQIWVQTEVSRVPIISKKRTNMIRIKKAALGSFIAQINGSGGIRVKRIE